MCVGHGPADGGRGLWLRVSSNKMTKGEQLQGICIKCWFSVINSKPLTIQETSLDFSVIMFHSDLKKKNMGQHLFKVKKKNSTGHS